MTNFYSRSVCALWLLGSIACDDRARGGAGESCVSADDCASGLACIAQVCQKRDDAGTPSATIGEGGSCKARRDCREGLTCTQNVCESMSAGVTPSGTRYGGRGESCQAKNDCEPDLACVGGLCRALNISLSRTSKSCHRVECSQKDDCCSSFTPNASCPTYKMNCDTDPVFCATYRSLCECSKDCVDEMCTSGPPGCMSNSECTSAQTPYCVSNKCRQCDKDSSCSGTNTKCVEGVCVAACMIDEHCPPLYACEKGACVERGCKSDRECVFLVNNPLAACKDGDCKVPCSSDTECMMPTTTAAGMLPGQGLPNMSSAASRSFQVCAEGECVFVGCESDEECRALLGLNNEAGGTRAVCK